MSAEPAHQSPPAGESSVGRAVCTRALYSDLYCRERGRAGGGNPGAAPLALKIYEIRHSTCRLVLGGGTETYTVISIVKIPSSRDAVGELDS